MESTDISIEIVENVFNEMETKVRDYVKYLYDNDPTLGLINQYTEMRDVPALCQNIEDRRFIFIMLLEDKMNFNFSFLNGYSSVFLSAIEYEIDSDGDCEQETVEFELKNLFDLKPDKAIKSRVKIFNEAMKDYPELKAMLKKNSEYVIKHRRNGQGGWDY